MAATAIQYTDTFDSPCHSICARRSNEHSHKRSILCVDFYFLFLIKGPVNREGRIRTFFSFSFLRGVGGECTKESVVVFVVLGDNVPKSLVCVCVWGDAPKIVLGENPLKRV